MNTVEFQQNITIQYCFPDNNLSCRKEIRANPGNIFLAIFFSCISICTVFLNLLVIISISHFKQLHTPTNLLILSLAVADFLVGLIVMPVKTIEFIDNCWYFGKMGCLVFPVINSFSFSASICSLIFIAVDRYIAVTDPLLYSTKVTVCKMSLFIILSWSFSLFYVIIFWYFNDHLLQSQIYTTCYGECVLFMKFPWLIVDLLLYFLTPCSVILILYSIIFNVARHQAKTVRIAINVTSHKHRAKVSNSSETKAAKTLGIVVFIYLACWIPFYLSSFSGETLTSLSVVWTVLGWLVCINSSVNPLIYAIFYPWFRASTRYILTCKLFKTPASKFNVFPKSF